MDIPEESQRVLDQCEPLAPDCLALLDFETLGTESERAELLEVFTDLYREKRGANRTTTPRTYARRVVDRLDDVTVNLLRPALWSENYYQKMLTKVRREAQEGTAYRASGMTIRNYLLLLHAACDLEQRSGTQRQFYGLHEVVEDEETGTGTLRYINLGTNEVYRGYVALFRYAVAVSNGIDLGREHEFFIPRSDEGLVIQPEVRELILEHPKDVDRLAAIVIERESQSADLLRSILSDINTPVLDSGAL